MVVQQTSVNVYKELQSELGERQLEVLQALRRFRIGACNRMIMDEVNNHRRLQGLSSRLGINSVTPRVYELRQKRLVEEWKKDTDPITNKTVIYWKTKQEVFGR